MPPNWTQQGIHVSGMGGATSCSNVPALGAPHAGLLPVFFLVGILAVWWAGMGPPSRRPRRRPRRMAAAVWTAVALSGLGPGERAWFVGATPKGLLTQTEFVQATWDWVQDTGAATATWGPIKDWDVSGVLDFSYAFSTSRDEGGSFVCCSENSNLKAKLFSGFGLDKWKTSAVTSLRDTFSGALAMTPDLASWDVSRVTSLQGTFSYASSMNTDFSSCTYGSRGGAKREIEHSTEERERVLQPTIVLPPPSPPSPFLTPPPSLLSLSSPHPPPHL